MKKALLLFFAIIYHYSFSQNPGEWVWLRGPNTSGGFGSYGTKGIPSSTNDPAALYEPCEWIDLNGNFWFYGGVDQNGGTRNDLWKYNPTTNEWTWVNGTQAINDAGNYGVIGNPSPTNRPPSKGWGTASWVDTAGNFWMFGGYNNLGYYSDLWKYDLTTNIWTWMKGPNMRGQAGVYGTIGVPNPANNPGCRGELAATWTDANNNLWFFGGQAPSPYDSYNDLWRYSIATNTWTWMKGSQITSQPGVYGVKGVENSSNTPGARSTYSHWKDNNGNFWLFGGNDFRYNKDYNDLWKYNPVTNNWTWIHGNNIPNSNFSYGTKCVTTSTNLPPGRAESRPSWTDKNGNFWFFGGNFHNDLWMYCIAENKWTWIKGDTIFNPSGSWGTKGVSSPTNKPNGRNGPIGWTDNQWHLYLFGGGGTPPIITYGDLWKFTIDSTCSSCKVISIPQAGFAPSDTTFCGEGVRCINFFDLSSGNPTGWQWLFPGAHPDTSTQQNPANICYWDPGIYNVTLIVANSVGTDTITVSPMITFSNGPPVPFITVRGDSLICNTPGFYNYQWYFNGTPIFGAIDSIYKPTQPGTYAVSIADSLGCVSVSNGVLSSINELSEQQIEIYPNPTTGNLTINLHFAMPKAYLKILNFLGEIIYQSDLSNKEKAEVDLRDVSTGVYVIQLSNQERQYYRKLLIQ